MFFLLSRSSVHDTYNKDNPEDEASIFPSQEKFDDSCYGTFFENSPSPQVLSQQKSNEYSLVKKRLFCQCVSIDEGYLDNSYSSVDTVSGDPKDSMEPNSKKSKIEGQKNCQSCDESEGQISYQSCKESDQVNEKEDHWSDGASQMTTRNSFETHSTLVTMKMTQRKSKSKVKQRPASMKSLMNFDATKLMYDDKVEKAKHFRNQRLMPKCFSFSSSMFDEFDNASLNVIDPIIDTLDNKNHSQHKDDFDKKESDDEVAETITCEPMHGDYHDFENDMESSLQSTSTHRNANFNKAPGALDIQASFPNVNVPAENLQRLMLQNAKKRFNMKAIRETSLKIINEESKASQHSVKFSVVHKKVAQAFRNSSERSSCSLTFLGVLQLVNDGKGIS
jgi:hypothetical protein